MTELKKVAIYSRKSLFTGKGDSIGNQIDLCKQYIDRTFINEHIEYLIYEDEGFSGSNIKRPKFQQLLKDAKNNKFDVLVCYRLDRISRNVADFSTTVEMLQDNNIDFISIKEQFDTTSPMGRAMMYISSVFAQLERETIAERVRDNLVELAKTGRWLGGQVPLGFEATKISYIDHEMKQRSLMSLKPIDKELEIIKDIYSKYIEYRSITQVVNYLNGLDIKGKNGGDFASMQVARILSSPLYVKSNKNTHEYLKSLNMNVYGTPNGNGYLSYNKTKNNRTKNRDISEFIVAIGKHPGTIEASDWILVQQILETNKHKKVKQTGKLGTGKSNALLTGVLKCSKCGSNMLIYNGGKRKDGTPFLYYACGKRKNNRNVNKCTNPNVPVDRLDKIVKKELLKYNKDFLEKLLEDAIKENTLVNVKEEMNNIEKDIKEKETIISNLVKKIALSPNEDVSKYLFEEINSLNNQIINLKNKLENLDDQDANKKNTIENIKMVKDAFNRFKNIENEDMQQRRFIIQTILEEAVWNGDTSTIELNIIGDKKK